MGFFWEDDTCKIYDDNGSRRHNLEEDTTEQGSRVADWLQSRDDPWEDD